MATSAISLDQDAIVNEIQVAAPPERVFRALTDANELRRWFSGPDCPAKSWKMDARVGGHYSYTNEKGSVVVNGVSEFECHGEILECDPPRLLVHTWISSYDTARTVVRWELEAETVNALHPSGPKKSGTGTRVRVTQEGFAGNVRSARSHGEGWKRVLGWLAAFVAGNSEGQV